MNVMYSRNNTYDTYVRGKERRKVCTREDKSSDLCHIPTVPKSSCKECHVKVSIPPVEANSFLGAERSSVAATSAATAAVARGRGERARLLFDVGARVGELDVSALGGGAAVVDVGDEHVGETGEVAALGAVDGDGRAVHVHLAVADVVEPGPGEDGVAAGGVLGDGEVPGGLEGAVAQVGLDDLPGGAAVVGQRGLAAAAAVGRRALDGEAVGLAGLPLGDGSASRGAEVAEEPLAGEVGAALGQRAVHAVVDLGGVRVVLGAEGGRVAHLHVSGGEGDHTEGGGGRGERESVLHLDGFWLWFVRRIRVGGL